MRFIPLIMLWIAAGFLFYPVRSYSVGGIGQTCPTSTGCMDSGFNEVSCSNDSQCSACDPAQTGGPDCSGGVCPIECFTYLNSTDCNASALGCTWDTSLTVYDGPCCVSSPSGAPELPSNLFWWAVLAIGASVALVFARRRPAAR